MCKNSKNEFLDRNFDLRGFATKPSTFDANDPCPQAHVRAC